MIPVWFALIVLVLAMGIIIGLFSWYNRKCEDELVQLHNYADWLEERLYKGETRYTAVGEINTFRDHLWHTFDAENGYGNVPTDR